MDVRERFSVKLLKIIYIFMGISFNPVHQKCLVVIAYGFCCFFTPTTLYFEIIALVTIQDAVFQSEAIVLLLFTFIYSVLVLFIQSQRALWVQFYENIKLSNDRIFDKNFLDDLDARLNADRGYYLLFLVIMSGAFFFPVIIFCTTNEEFGSYATFMYPAKYPWKVNTLPTYLLTTVFQILCIWVSSCVFVGNLTFIYYFRAFLLTVKLMLKRRIRNLVTDGLLMSQDRLKNGKKVSFADFNSKEKDIQQLHEIVFDHQFFSRIGNEYKVIMSPVTHMSILNFFISGVLITFTTFLAGDSLLYRLKLTNLQLLIYYHLLYFCSVGQIFENLNTGIMFNLYEINWYQKSITFRTEMLRFMTFLQKQQHIKIFKTRILNWMFVATIIRITYSVLQVLMRAQGKTI